MKTIDAHDLTGWMPGHLQPAREGVYERRSTDGGFSCWNGQSWNADADTPAEAAGRDQPSRSQSVAWRGLVAPSDQPCATCNGHTIVDRGYDEDAATDRFEECPDC